MSKRNIILVGGGGHCKSVIDVIETENKYAIIGILDTKEKIGQKILGYEVIGTDEDISSLTLKDIYFIVTVGHIKSFVPRKKIYTKLKEHGARLATICSPNAYVSKHGKIEEGTIVMHHAFVNAGARIGINCIINTNAIIEHDAFIGNHCHISTATLVNGDCVVQDNCFIGSNATLRNGITVKNNTIIGAGAFVSKDILTEGSFVGNPARKL